MAISRPIGKNAKIALFSKETTEGTFVAPSQSHHFVSEGLKYTPQSVEDPSNIGKLFTSDMIKSGYNVEGSVEMKAHPYFMGDALFFTLGKSDSPVNPAQGFLLIWYKGSAALYVRIRKLTTAIVAETSPDNVTWTADATFGTAGSLTVTGLTLTQIATTINGYANYRATYLGYASSPVTNLADWSNTFLRYNGVNVGSCIQPYLVTSTIAKCHSIYADDSALADIPSMSIAIDRNYGTAKDIGLAGCKVSSLAIALEPKSLVGLSVGLKAKTQDNAYTYAASDVPTSKAFTTNLSKVFVDGLLTQDIKSMNLTINNNFFTDEAVGVETFNSQGRQGASADVSGTLNLTVTDATDEETIALQSKMQNDTPVEVIIYMENLDYADTANNAKYSALIRLRAVKLTDCSPVVSGPERITLPIAGKAVANVVGRHIDTWVTNMRTTAY